MIVPDSLSLLKKVLYKFFLENIGVGYGFQLLRECVVKIAGCLSRFGFQDCCQQFLGGQTGVVVGCLVDEGEVIAVGPGARQSDGKLIPVSCQIGDLVLVPEYGGSMIKMGDEEFQLFRDGDILGKFDN